MGSKKKFEKKKKEAKPVPESKLMDEVAKSNPHFVNWLKNKKQLLWSLFMLGVIYGKRQKRQ